MHDENDANGMLCKQVIVLKLKQTTTNTMKQFFSFLACVMLATGTSAQTKGTVIFGANMQRSQVAGTTENLYNLDSRIGIFVNGNLAVGLNMETGLNKNSVSPFSLNAFGRYYAGNKTHQVVKIFVEGGVGLAKTTVTTGIGDGEAYFESQKHPFKATLYVSPGVNVFLGKVAALEIAPEYRYVAAKEPAGRLGISAGVKFFLSEQLFKKIFPHTFVKLH